MVESGSQREKVVSKLPAALRRDLKVRAAQNGIDIQDAVEAGIRAWLADEHTHAVVNTSGADSFSTTLPDGLYEDFQEVCTTRKVSYIQGLAQAITLWLATHDEESGSVVRKPRRIVVCNQKGGVGKTTVTAGLGAAFAIAGHRVLIVDYDPQGHLSKQLGVEPIQRGEESLVKHMAGTAKGDIADLVVALEYEEYGDRLHLLPAATDGFLLDVTLSTVRAREATLSRALEPLQSSYDAIIVDCPPSLGLSTDAGIRYGHRHPDEPEQYSGILIPVEAEDSSADAFSLLISQIEDLEDDLNLEIDHLGLVVNKYDSRKGHIFTSSLSAWKQVGEPAVVAIVNELKEQREAVRKRLPLLSYAPESDQSKTFMALVQTLIDRSTV